MDAVEFLKTLAKEVEKMEKKEGGINHGRISFF